MASALSLIGSTFFASVAFAAKNELTNRACWQNLKVVNVDIESSAATTSNPIHTEGDAEGSTVEALRSEDLETLKIFNPSRIKIAAYAADLSSVDEVLATFFDVESTLTISTKGITANNMMVMSVDLTQAPESVSAVQLVIDLEQALPPTVESSFNPSQSSDSSTYGVSIQNPPATANSPLTLFNKLSLSF